MIDLPDINLWLALVDQRHVHHPLAQDYWSQSGANQFAFCRTTMLGFLRLTTSAKAVLQPKTGVEAWGVYQAFLSLPNILFLSEPAGLDVQFEALSCHSSFPHRLWTDAYLAAFAMTSGCRLVSFDADFARFSSLDFLHLGP